MEGFEKQIKKILKEHGWYMLRSGKGSHEIWTNGQLTVTVNHVCKSKHTANAIMKQAKIHYKF